MNESLAEKYVLHEGLEQSGVPVQVRGHLILREAIGEAGGELFFRHMIYYRFPVVVGGVEKRKSAPSSDRNRFSEKFFSFFSKPPKAAVKKSREASRD